MITAAFPFRQPTPAEVELAACDLYLKSRANPPNAKIAFIRLPVQASKKKALLSYMKQSLSSLLLTSGLQTVYLLLLLDLSFYRYDSTHMEPFMENRSDKHLLNRMHPHICWRKFLFQPVPVILLNQARLFPKQ